MPNDVAAGGCPPASDWHDLLSDRAASREREVLERHLEECAHCLDTLAGLAEGDSKPGNLTPRSHETAVGALSDSSRELLQKLADPRTFRAGLAEVARSQPVPEIEGLDDFHQVGRGGTGVVYRARQLSTNRPVAVKLLSLGPSRQGSARVLREAELLGRLRHPHVVTIHGSGVCGGTPYLLMEWVAGGTLQQRLERGEIPIQQAVLWTIELTQAVAAAHALGIVHRDLKPANVLLEPASEPGQSDEIKLTDFGLAQDQSSDQQLTWSGQVLGTPHYMAPEQTGLLPELGEPGPACDVYGLGAILFALLSGRPPHGGVSTSQTLLRVSEQEPPAVSHLRPEVPFDLTTIVAKCLRQHPAQRYASARELQDDLQRFVQGKPIMARPYPLTERIAKWVRRRPMSAVALLLLCALIGGSVWSNVRLAMQGRELASLTFDVQRLEGLRRAARADLDVTERARSEAHAELENSRQQLDESRQQLQELQRLQDEMERRQQVMNCMLFESESQWRGQTESLHRQMFHLLTFLENPNAPYQEEQWNSLMEFRNRTEQDVRAGLYRNADDRELTRLLANLLLRLGFLWERKQGRPEFAAPVREAQRCNDLLAHLLANEREQVTWLPMQLESRMRWLRLSRLDNLEAPPNLEQATQARDLLRVLEGVGERESITLNPALATNCLMMIQWGVSHQAARDLVGRWIAEIQALVGAQRDAPELRKSWLWRLRTQALLDIDGPQSSAKQIVEEMRRVAREAQEDFPKDSDEYIVIRMDTLRHWCHSAERARAEHELPECLAMWREGLEELSRLGGIGLNDQIPVAGRLIPLEARLLQRRGEWSAARDLLTWFQRVTDVQAPQNAPFQWQQAQARARLGRARLELLWGRQESAEVLVGEALDRLSRWLTDPTSGREAHADWFDARLTWVETRIQKESFEVLHRELLDLFPHCPPESKARYARALFDTALRSGHTAAARKALSLIDLDQRSKTPVGEELDNPSLKACLESMLQTVDPS